MGKEGSAIASSSGSLEGRSVALVLGSGGARGLAHMGVIHALEAAGADIQAIAGSSMGALVGGMYAAGQLNNYQTWVETLERSDVLSMVDWTLSGGLIRGKKITQKLAELAGEVNIEDLDIDFTAVAVDIDQGREVWLDHGSLYEAIRASIAIPGLFTPHPYRGRTLVDGGLLNPIPISPTLRSMCDLTIVVNVNGAEDPQDDEQTLPSGPEQGDEVGLMDRVRELIENFSKDKPKAEHTQPGLIAVLIRSLDTMEAAIARHNMAMFSPDLVITVPKGICQAHEFYRAGEVRRIGEKIAQDALKTFRPHHPRW
ncbi:MAG: patatin-like phospholipase family protein [Wenzhouxiangella sp.]|nr:patatin-like phospholipase family protein [Wenzhouxiangella sp.]